MPETHDAARAKPARRRRRKRRVKLPSAMYCYNVYCPFRNNVQCGGAWSCTNWHGCAEKLECRVVEE